MMPLSIQLHQKQKGHGVENYHLFCLGWCSIHWKKTVFFFNSKTKDNNRTQYCIPGPSKGCHMVPKGCQFTIPYGSIGTPWKVLVGWPGYRVTTPTISHTIRVGQTGQPWVGDEKPSRQNSWMEMKMSNGEYEPSSNFCITEFSVLQLDIYIYI